MPGNPLYVTASSSGPGKWNSVDTGVTPQQLSWLTTFTSSLGTGANIEVAIDNPFNFGSSVTGSLGGLAVAPSSQAPYNLVLATYASSVTGQTPQYLTNVGSTVVAGPIYAWRLNMTSSNLTTYVTFLQAGKKQ